MNKFTHLVSQPAGAENHRHKLSRRGFVISATSTGFTLAFVPASLLLTGRARAMVNEEFEPTVWYTIDQQGLITVNIAEAEMGQHVGTALARIIADELEANWEDVRLNYVDSESRYGYRVTGGSWSVWHNFDLLSRAGAAGRKTLIEEGAKLLGTTALRCVANGSQVISGNKSVSYAEIVRKGDMTRKFSEEELAKIQVKKPQDRQLVGKESQGLDIPEKTTGSAVYGIDAIYDGMVFAKPLLPPTRYGSSIKNIDDRLARGVKGYQQTITLDDPSGTVPGWALVIADSYHAALAAERLIKVDWQLGDTAGVSEAAILEYGANLIESSKGSIVVEEGDVDAAFKSADSVLTESYTTNTVLHFQLEPLNAIALERNGIWELHTGNQWQSLALPLFAAALGVTEDKIIMRTYLLGGGFGRRLNGDYGVPALLAAKVLGKPVKVVFSREDDSRFDSPRSASVQKVSMAFDSKRRVIGMQHHAVAGWPSEVMAPFIMVEGKNGEKFDPFSINGADHWYSVGAHRVRSISNDLASQTFRPGWLRSAAPGWTNWALESFMDEAATKIGVDPVAFRLQYLISKGNNAGSAPDSVRGANRLYKVLRRLSKKVNWGQPLPADTGLGVATTFGQERAMPTWCACAAQVHVDRESGKVTLQKVTLVIDAGSIVHPDGALAQAEGAALWGVSMALHEGTHFENGEVKDTNLDSYTPLRMADVPELDIEFAESDYQSVGLGEPATTVVGPAIGNAIFTAVGARVRHLPITPDAVLKALSG
ncbi:MAG: molybdopterin cofactor-binding domain-containing protein [bacterium]|nr:xanthine dehydrogenase family protein molybdopterin-binding subunit [Gammaproteobacteria bacterium]HIL96501.1 xanthine dehydrogenase family protein molybdopterin-binding subunit [Pseudomonadales bacterium]